MNGSLPINLKDAQLAPDALDKGDTLASAVKAGKIYVEDHSSLPDSSMLATKDSFLARPITLFYESATKGLVTLAIQLEHKGLIVTPKDGMDWTLAKMVSNWAVVHATAVDHFLYNVIGLQNYFFYSYLS